MKHRILMIIGSNPATVGFTNNFVSKHQPIGIIQQSGGPEGDGFVEIKDINSKPKFQSSGNNIAEDVLGEVYDNIYVDNPSDVIHFKVPKGRLNKDEELKKQIKEMNVDIIISHGPERIGTEIISMAKYGGINIHWGLSPIYKGTHTVRWPLLHEKPEWIGVTIHKLDRNLDTGPILYQAKPDLQTDWSYRHIEYSLTKLSYDIVPKAMEEVLSGKNNVINQDLSEGKTYFSKEYTEECESKLNNEYVSKQIENYLLNKNNLDKGVELINEWK